MRKVDYERKRWFIAVAAGLMQLCLGAVYAWFICKIPLVQSLGWGDPVARTTMVVMMAAIGVAAFFGSSQADKMGVRQAATLGAVLLGLGTLLAGFAAERNNLLMFYIGYGVVGGCGFGLAYITSIAVLIRWFPDHRGLILGAVLLGFGAGVALMGYFEPIMFLTLGGAKTCYVMGAVILFLATGATQLIANPPEGWLPKGFTPPDPDVATADSFTFGEAIRTPQWWMLWAMLFLNVTAGLGFLSQLSPLAQYAIRKIVENVTPEELVRQEKMIVGLASICIGLGPLLWAAVSDHIGRRSVMITLFSAQFMLYIFQPYVSYVMQFAGIAGFLLSCFGGGFAMMAAYTADSFGTGHIGRVYGALLSAWVCAGIFALFLFSIPEVKPVTLYVAAGLVLLGTLITSFYQLPERRHTPQ
jgi:OFA family oxalate/formate antiporter-like MFS transporter